MSFECILYQGPTQWSSALAACLVDGATPPSKTSKALLGMMLSTWSLAPANVFLPACCDTVKLSIHDHIPSSTSYYKNRYTTAPSVWIDWGSMRDYHELVFAAMLVGSCHWVPGHAGSRFCAVVTSFGVAVTSMDASICNMPCAASPVLSFGFISNTSVVACCGYILNTI